MGISRGQRTDYFLIKMLLARRLVSERKRTVTRLGVENSGVFLEKCVRMMPLDIFQIFLNEWIL